MNLLMASGDLEVAHAWDGCVLERMLTRSRQELRGCARFHCVIHDIKAGVQESLTTVTIKRECHRLTYGRRMLTGGGVSYDILPIVTPGPAQWRHDVALALEPLPPHYREMVLLHDLESPTTAGMAQRLDFIARRQRLHRSLGVRSRISGSMRFPSARPVPDRPLRARPLPLQLEL